MRARLSAFSILALSVMATLTSGRADPPPSGQAVNFLEPMVVCKRHREIKELVEALRISLNAYDAKLNLNYCYVRAPFDAYVTNLNITIGQYANQGREVLSLVDNRTWYVLANFRENFLGHIRPGMSAQVYLLSYPNKRFRGRVQGVGWALYQNNGATIEGLPQVEETLNWVRLSQRFPVRIILERGDPALPFRQGQTAVVTIQGDR